MKCFNKIKNVWPTFCLFLLIIPFKSWGVTFSLAWPTPNPSFAQGLGAHTFLQKTGPTKSFTSGAFGCVRNNGFKFHEGLDLFPIKTNKLGKAEDTVFAAMKGIVAYTSHSTNQSAYGKYIVLEHEEFSPTLYTLYAHLDQISPDLKLGTKVNIAQALGKMGNSASFHIPLNRSHLHFEVGLRLSDEFNKWFNRQSFKTKNKHGNFNGYNLVGFDPIHFYSSFQNKYFTSPGKYLRSLPVVTKIQINATFTPYLIRRNPSLLLNKSVSTPLAIMDLLLWSVWNPPTFRSFNRTCTRKYQSFKLQRTS